MTLEEYEKIQAENAKKFRERMQQQVKETTERSRELAKENSGFDAASINDTTVSAGATISGAGSGESLEEKGKNGKS